MHFVSVRRESRLFAVASASIVLAVLAVLTFAVRAQAAETIYWDNYGANPDNAAFANIDGSGGGVLNAGSESLEAPEGQAYDTVTNRLFVPAGIGVARHIVAINLDGSGAAPFTAPGAPVDQPEGVTVDPISRTIYWENTGATDAIAWAKLDGSTGGVLSTSGVTLSGPCCRIAVDPSAGRVYFVNFPGGNGTVAYVNTNNSGGGELNLAGATIKADGEGVAVDGGAGRVYFLGGTNEIGFANTNGTGGGNVSTGGAPINGPWGLALDPSIGRLYWGNESNGTLRTNAIGFVGTNGSGVGGINIATAPVANPQDPVILKSPSATGAPTIAQDAKKPASLTCSQGSWGADFPGSFVYQAPRSYAYQWSNNGAAVGGATTATYLATVPGSYTCAVTATNQTGSASQTSAATKIVASKVKLKTKKKAKVKPGGVATFKVSALNQGDLEAKTAKVCAKLPKKARKAMKAPKCKKFGNLAADGKRTATLKFKVKKSAKPGTYKLTFQVKGSAGKAAKAKVLVKAPKPKK